MNEEFDCNKCNSPLIEGEIKYCSSCIHILKNINNKT
jgi:hypothetical protein